MLGSDNTTSGATDTGKEIVICYFDGTVSTKFFKMACLHSSYRDLGGNGGGNQSDIIVAQLSQEVYNSGLLLLLLRNLHMVDFEGKKDAVQVFNNLLRRQIGTRTPTVEYICTKVRNFFEFTKCNKRCTLQRQLLTIIKLQFWHFYIFSARDCIYIMPWVRTSGNSSKLWSDAQRMRKVRSTCKDFASI